MATTKQRKDLYVLMLDGEILSAESFKKYCKGYGHNDMHGWRPPKKVYYTKGAAKSGRRYVPKEIQDKVEIHLFQSVGKITE